MGPFSNFVLYETLFAKSNSRPWPLVWKTDLSTGRHADLDQVVKSLSRPVANKDDYIRATAEHRILGKILMKQTTQFRTFRIVCGGRSRTQDRILKKSVVAFRILDKRAWLRQPIFVRLHRQTTNLD